MISPKHRLFQQPDWFEDSWMKFKKIMASGMIGKILHARIDSFWRRGSHY